MIGTTHYGGAVALATTVSKSTVEKDIAAGLRDAMTPKAESGYGIVLAICPTAANGHEGEITA